VFDSVLYDLLQKGSATQEYKILEEVSSEIHLMKNYSFLCSKYTAC
jgi:hypothetical protein